MIQDIVEKLVGKTIIIAGFGREGRSTLAFLRKYLPEAPIAIADKNANAFSNVDLEGIKTISGEDYLKAIHDYDVVIKTPGISLLGVDCKGVNITSQTDLFLSAFHNQVIGITGTKGKSTTSSLINHLLKSAGYKSILAGNIGIPILDIVDDVTDSTIVVYELSAHQLQYISRSPHVGILLNVFEEHLDHFGTFENYCNAKLNIVRKMQPEDVAVLGGQFAGEQIVAKSIFYENDGCKTLITSEMKLQGEHNIKNACAAMLACSAFTGKSVGEFAMHLSTFEPLEHRLERVGRFDGVTFYNDSISTIPQAAIAAVNTLKRVDFLLLGGFDRGIDYEPLIDFLMNNHIPNILFTGHAGERIHNLLISKGYQGKCFDFNNLESAFEIISANTKEGDVCLLSPAAASYDQYKNFEERGSKFKKLASAFKRSY